MRTSGTHEQVAGGGRAYFLQLRRVLPDVQKPLLPHIAAGQRKLHARIDVSIRRDVAGRMPGAARQAIQNVFIHCRRRRTELLHVAHQIRIAKDLSQVLPANSQSQDGAIPVDLGRTRRVDRVHHP